jgi:ATP-dependent DNA helicase RecG
MAGKDLQLSSDVQFVKSVGPARATALRRLGILTAGDLLGHWPRNHLDRSASQSIGSLVPGQTATIAGEVLTCGERRTRRGSTQQTVTVADETGVIFCVWFNQRFVLKQFQGGRRVMMSGVVQSYSGRRQLVHPDYEVFVDEPSDGDDPDQTPLHTGRLVPVYPLTAGIGQHWLRRLIHRTLEQLAPQLDDPLPSAWRRERALLPLSAAIAGLHFPRDGAELAQARRRLVYQELLEIQLVMALRRGGFMARPGLALSRPGDLTRRLVESLPFELTSAQRRVLAEILADLRRGQVMHRLLQGDVGSGKTLVAFIAALFCIEQGFQALFMAPTEVLARQHGQTLRRLAEPLGVTVETLTGSTPAKQRRAIVAAAATRDVQLLVGTHAVLQEQARLPDLALAIVDEQHRFGVRQRGESARGDDDTPVHLLVMSATPIPRSLALTLYGDLDLSIIDAMPAGRQPVSTFLEPASREDRVLARCLDLARAGKPGFVVYPVVAESESTDIKAAEAEVEVLRQGVFRDLRVGLVHGRLKAAEKNQVMDDFAAGELDVLVATTVVEVGIDVPQAAWMVIQGAERFGLAQLHQLRGRVGRGGGEAWCWLIPSSQVSAETEARLRFFADHHDGFALAEEDLRQRGPGDLWGVRQHGVPGFRLANPLRDGDLAAQASQDGRLILQTDPDLASAAWRPLRTRLVTEFGKLVPLSAG